LWRRVGKDAEPQTEYTIALAERPDPSGPLPANACFVGVRGYDLQMLTESPRGEALCTDLVKRYLDTDERLPWPPPDLLDPDRVNECVLEHDHELIAVSAADDEWALGRATAICEGLQAARWTSYFDEDLPAQETTDAEESTCAIATQNLQVELVAWPAEGAGACAELDSRYLRGEGRDWPPTREGGVPVAACTGERGERTVNVMAVEKAGIERLKAICRALKHDGWGVIGPDDPTDRE